ncbi:type II toxin-antitoxin system antitoxin DNA ADP-ribosyl glycohydrolase DarG [Thermopirellula anaerolimosa]
MIEITQGNIIEADAEALVNTVNCQGFMGKGIALQFKKAFPDNFKAYERACRAGDVRPGRMFVFPIGMMTNPKYIINFPTKRKWREKSRMEDIEAGLAALVDELRRLKVSSVAVPPLGCGHGGLDWGRVRPLIERALAALPDVRVMLFEPLGAPEARAMPVRTQRPRLTLARALLIRLMRQYTEMAYRLTLLEIQKLAYFLQESGEPLRLNYVGHLYGPYAHNLNKVLETLEGHFIRGYGDSQKPDVEIELLPGATDEADRFLATDAEAAARLQRVADLIDGFETPYGMELLSSVHWVACHGKSPVRNADQAIQALHRWNDRKRLMFKPEHVRVAWDRLLQAGWIMSAADTSKEHAE